MKGATQINTGVLSYSVIVCLSVASLCFSQVDAAALPVDSASGESWLVCRGCQQATGVSRCDFPKNPVLLWKYKAADAVCSSAAIADDAVYFGCDDGTVCCLHVADGKTRWQFAASGPVRSSPLVMEKTIIVGDEDGFVYGFDRASGRKSWVVETGGQVISSANCAGDRVFIGSYDGYVYCLSSADGSCLWKYSAGGRVHGSPTVAAEFVLVVGCDEQLHVLDRENGKAIRTVSLGSPSGVSAAVVENLAFVGTYGGRVLGINWRSGEVLWVFEDVKRNAPFMASAVSTQQAVVVGGRDKRLRRFDPATGKVVWEFAASGKIESSPILVDRRVLLGTTDGNLYAVDIDSGKSLWQYTIGAGVSAGPTAAAGRVFVGTEDGLVLCFGKSPTDSEKDPQSER